MSYITVYDGIKGILEGVSLSESSQGFKITNIPENEYGRVFILNEVSGEQNIEDSREIINKFHDEQTWQILIPYDNGSKQAKAAKFEIGKKRDEILAKLDNPTNWTSFVRQLKYVSWEIEELDNYNVLIITLEVNDTITHT